jgi:spore maturation protein SpmA
VDFNTAATTNSKIMFLCYASAQIQIGNHVTTIKYKTPFSDGTTLVIPDLASTLMGLTAFGSAYGLYYLRKRKIMKI